MDQDQMEQAGPVQCRNGCGFYSNAGTDGLCSVCYKDCIKKKQQPPTNMPASLVPTSMAPSGNGSSSSPPQMTSLSIGDEMANAITSSVPSSSPTLTNSNKSGPISVETGSPTVILPSSSSTLQTEKRNESESDPLEAAASVTASALEPTLELLMMVPQIQKIPTGRVEKRRKIDVLTAKRKLG